MMITMRLKRFVMSLKMTVTRQTMRKMIMTDMKRTMKKIMTITRTMENMMTAKRKNIRQER